MFGAADRTQLLLKEEAKIVLGADVRRGFVHKTEFMTYTANTQPAEKSLNVKISFVAIALGLAAGAGFLVGRAMKLIANGSFSFTDGLTLVLVPLLIFLAVKVTIKKTSATPNI